MVVAEAARQAEPIGRRQRPFAEEGELIQFVAEVGEEQAVLGGAEAAGGDAAEILEPGHQQVLAVGAVRVAEEPAGHPRTVLAAGKAQLLGPHFRLGGVVQRGVERVDLRRQADAAARDAGRQRGRVAKHENVAGGVRGDRRQRDVAEAVIGVDIAEREIIRELLRELRELLVVAERHRRPCRGEGIREDVEGVAAVPAVAADSLIDDPRRDGETGVRHEFDRRPYTGPKAVVDVLLHSEVGLDRLDVPGEAVEIRSDAQRSLATQWDVEAELAVAAPVPPADGAAPELDESLPRGELGLIGDVTHRSRQ